MWQSLNPLPRLTGGTRFGRGGGGINLSVEQKQEKLSLFAPRFILLRNPWSRCQNIQYIVPPADSCTQICTFSLILSRVSNLTRGSNMVGSLDILFSVLGFELALNWNRFLGVQWRGSNFLIRPYNILSTNITFRQLERMLNRDYTQSPKFKMEYRLCKPVLEPGFHKWSFVVHYH